MSDVVVVALVSAIPTTLAALTAGAAFIVGLQNKNGIKKAQEFSKLMSDRVDGQLDTKITALTSEAHLIGQREGEDKVRAEFAQLATVAAQTKVAVDAAREVVNQSIAAAKIVAEALVAKTAADALMAAQAAPAAPHQPTPVVITNPQPVPVVVAEPPPSA
jgi:hypothetical protein